MKGQSNEQLRERPLGDEEARVMIAQGQTIFMVTHNPENAALGHRIINIRDGRTCRESAPQADRVSETIVRAAQPNLMVL